RRSARAPPSNEKMIVGNPMLKPSAPTARDDPVSSHTRQASAIWTAWAEMLTTAPEAQSRANAPDSLRGLMSRRLDRIRRGTPGRVSGLCPRQRVPHSHRCNAPPQPLVRRDLHQAPRLRPVHDSQTVQMVELMTHDACRPSLEPRVPALSVRTTPLDFHPFGAFDQCVVSRYREAPLDMKHRHGRLLNDHGVDHHGVRNALETLVSKPFVILDGLVLDDDDAQGVSELVRSDRDAGRPSKGRCHLVDDQRCPGRCAAGPLSPETLTGSREDRVAQGPQRGHAHPTSCRRSKILFMNSSQCSTSSATATAITGPVAAVPSGGVRRTTPSPSSRS